MGIRNPLTGKPMIKNQARIKERVLKVFAEHFGNNATTLSPTDNIQETFFPDDLDLVELLMALEDEFDIEIPDGEVEGAILIQNVIDWITNKVG